MSASDVARIQAARNSSVGGPLDDGAPIGKQRHFIWLMPELQNKVVVADGAVRFQAHAHFGEVYRPVPFVNLHRVSSA